MKQIAFALMLAFAAVPFLSAHEGHDHKVMGTVAAVRDGQFDVRAADGKIATFSVDDKTKIVRGTTTVKAADIKVGERVVVAVPGAGKAPLAAKEVRLGASAPVKTASRK